MFRDEVLKRKSNVEDSGKGCGTFIPHSQRLSKDPAYRYWDRLLFRLLLCASRECLQDVIAVVSQLKEAITTPL